jgi:hypothetical protein
VPESEMALSAKYVGAKDASVVAECRQGPELKVAAAYRDGVPARCRDDGSRAAGDTVSYYVTA